MDLPNWMGFMTDKVREPFAQEQLEAIDRIPTAWALGSLR
jgi:hypothetical protein